MKPFLAWIWKGYVLLAAYAVALVVAVAGVLFLRGGLTGERLREAAAVLRGRPAPPAPAPPPGPSRSAAEREEILEKRFGELRRLEDRVTARVSLLRAEQEELEARQKAARSVIEQEAKAREDLAQARSEAELDWAVPVLSRMEAAGIVSVLRVGDDARFVRTLRAMRPTKAAEVLEALRTDPEFEEEFRRVPAGSPPGTRPRAERIYEEFQKAPGGDGRGGTPEPAIERR